MDFPVFLFYFWVYCYTGFSLKLIDQVNDEGFKVKIWIKNVIIISSPILAGIVMGLDLYNGSVGLILIIGLLFTKKINVKDFKIYTILVLCSMVLISISNQFYVFVNFPSIILTIIFLLVGVMADELLNNFLDSRNFSSPIIKKVAEIRPILKIVAFILPILNLFTFYHAIMILGLDIAYDLTRYFTEEKMKKEGISAQSSNSE